MNRERTGRMVCSVSMHTPVFQKVEKLAEEENRTISSMVFQLVVEALEHRGIKKNQEKEAV